MARLDSNVFPALSESTVAKLHSRGIFTVYDFMLQTCEDLMKKTGLSFKDVENIREMFLKSFGGETQDPLELYERESRDKIATGITDLDKLLEGGLHCRQIYEICGSSSAGKSQLCHWISMYATSSASTEVHYIDCSRNFCASRIQMILDAKQCSDAIIGKVMSNIKVHRISRINNLITILHHLTKPQVPDQSKLPKQLVIVDSLSVLCSILPNDYEYNSTLSNFASVCRFFVNHFRAAILIVNTVRGEYSGGSPTKDDKNISLSMRPSLGNYWSYIPNVRLLITHLENTKREISVWNSSQLENGKKCFVDIKDEGIFGS